MHGFQRFLQSSLAICILLTEYLLLFDRWIITPPSAPLNLRRAPPSAANRRKAWLRALQTSAAYAVFEPVCCWLIAHLGFDLIYWMFGAAFAHIWMVRASCEVKILAFKKVIKEHREQCVPNVLTEEGTGGEPEARYRDLGPSDSSEEAERGQLLQAGTTESADYDEKGESTPNDEAARRPAPCPNHRVSPSVHLANYPPILTAAMTNSAVLLYARFLPTEDSLTWLNGFALGWTVIILLIFFCVGAAKHVNSLMHEACSRPTFPPMTIADVGQRLSCLAVLLTIRTCLRLVLSQTPFNLAKWSDSQSSLILQGSPVGHIVVRQPNDANDDSSEGRRVVWQWVCISLSLLMNGIWIGHSLHAWLKQRRERRRENVD